MSFVYGVHCHFLLAISYVLWRSVAFCGSQLGSLACRGLAFCGIPWHSVAVIGVQWLLVAVSWCHFSVAFVGGICRWCLSVAFVGGVCQWHFVAFLGVCRYHFSVAFVGGVQWRLSVAFIGI